MAAGKKGAVKKETGLMSIPIETIDGDKISLNKYKGKVLLVVNVASRCGFTSQYDGLESLYQKYKDQGLVVLGFPANNFGNQEPGSNEEIKSFCSLNFNVTFPMMAKVSVKGDSCHPLYQYLTSKKEGHRFGGKISWNFNKFLIGRNGHVVDRFGSMVKPGSQKMTMAIEKALAQ
ncbi:glutathione peroxidase [Candidatus Marinamargulisbacteria bacterium SCGC AG-439-L15]|nr:glutathione peroxidase [Candidatus Marinamargulisbacteria bacterium SCGC AG-439-L15]